MTDRHLLEAAAKAAGIRLHVWGTRGQENYSDRHGPPGSRWMPLTDDGDAFRLAVKLGLSIEVRHDESQPLPWLWIKQYSRHHEPLEFVPPKDYAIDPAAATRRAIVEVAALIGEAMP